MLIKPTFMGFGVCLATQDGMYLICLTFFYAHIFLNLKLSLHIWRHRGACGMPKCQVVVL